MNMTPLTTSGVASICRFTAVKLVNPSELKLRDIRGSEFGQGAVPPPIERA